MNESKNKSNIVPVVFITDENYLIPTAVAITSLIENKKEDTFYEIYIIVADLNREFGDKLNSFKNENVTVKTFKVNGDKYKKFQRDGHYISTTVLFKFEIANLLPEYEKILYLDGDILVKADLAELYHLELGNHYVGAVRDIYAEIYCKTHKILSVNKYFNAGVMVLNLKKIREDHLSDKMVKVMEERWNDFIFRDQDVFNDIFKENVLWLEPKYNMIISSLVLENKSIEEVNEFFMTSHKNIEELVKEASIIHLAGGEKPWCNKYSFMNKDWFEYFKKSPFRDSPELRNFETQTWEVEIQNQRKDQELALKNRELTNKTNELNAVYNSKIWQMISKIADNYARMKRLNNLAKKSGLILTKQGPVVLFKKVLSYIKERNEFKRTQNKFTFSSQPTKKGKI
jgi:lipopolysaccharide biosynthesis glycosyltransferase